MNMHYPTPVIESAEELTTPSVLLPAPALTTRGITEHTCADYLTYSTGTPLEIVTAVKHYGQIIGWHYRRDGWTAGRTKQTWWAPGSQRFLVGTHLLPDSVKYDGGNCAVYLSEGVTDAMAIYQTLNTTNSVSLCYSGNPDKQAFPTWVDYIRSIASAVYLCFDNDDAGRAYTAQFLKLWGTQNIHGLVLPPGIKDAAELLMSGKSLAFERLPRLPPTIYKAQQVVERATQSQLATALSTGIKPLDTLINGYTPGKFILVSGIAKQGKSEFVVDLAVRYIRTHRLPVMFIPLELTMYETLQRFPPDTHEFLYFVEHFGFTTEKFIEENIRACPQLGVFLVIIDHITAAGTSFTEGLQTSAIDALVYQLKALINELDLALIGVSHTNASCTGIVEPHHLRGSAALIQVPSVTFGVRRLENGIMELRSVTPDRDTGQMGRINFIFERETGFTFYESHLL
jgi:AAA domain/Toprim-like